MNKFLKAATALIIAIAITAIFRPRKLYALEHISTGKIIFNARGGAYKLREEAEDKLKRLGVKGYRIIVYELRAR